MAAQQCRESERFHGIICCYIGFAFFSPLQIPDRQPFPALCPARQPLGRPCSMLSRFLGTLPRYPGSWRCFPKSGTAEDAIQLSREEVYLPSITMDSVGVWEWDGKNINIFVVCKWCSGSRKCLLLNRLNDFVLNGICG